MHYNQKKKVVVIIGGMFILVVLAATIVLMDNDAGKPIDGEYTIPYPPKLIDGDSLSAVIIYSFPDNKIQPMKMGPGITLRIHNIEDVNGYERYSVGNGLTKAWMAQDLDELLELIEKIITENNAESLP